MAKRDYYEVLGVDKSASDAEIKSAYRRMAKKHHPDLHSSKSDSERKQHEDKFKEASHAFDVLSDKQKKASYDRFGSEDGPSMEGGFGGFGGGGFSGFGGFDDIINNIFSGFGGGSTRRSSTSTNSGRKDGSDIGVEITIDFNEAAFGCKKEITITRNESCKQCSGTGAKDAKSYKTCGKCKGTGQVKYQQNSIFGTTVTVGECDLCKGTGKIITEKCSDCSGKGFTKKTHIHKVIIPAGIDNGQRMTYHGEGNCGVNGGKKGSLVVFIKVKPHKYLKREDYNLFVDVPISFVTAAVGGDIEVPTLEGVIKHKIPSGTESGDTFRLKGRGIKHLRRDSRGDLYVNVSIETPVKLSSKQKDLLDKFQKSLSKSQEPKIKKFYK